MLQAYRLKSNDLCNNAGAGVWRLGEARREPVLLSKSLSRLWADPSLFDRVRVAGAGIRVIAPRAAQMSGAPFATGVEWLPLEERFTFYGGGIAYIPSGVSPEAVAADDPRAPIYGPFSADFRWVTLSDRPEPIHCSEGQAAVFGALWGFKGQQAKAEAIMSRAGLSSDKPSDLFKVRPRDKGKPQYEAQHHAYEVSWSAINARVCTGCRARPQTWRLPDGLLIQAGCRTRKIDTRTTRCRARRCACATAKKLAEIPREQRAEKGRTGRHRHRV